MRGNGFSDIIDGSSNTVAFAEVCLGNPGRPEDVRGNFYQANAAYSSFAANTLNPSAVQLQAVVTLLKGYTVNGGGKLYTTPNMNTGWQPGSRWTDGRPWYSSVATIVPPNGPSEVNNDGSAGVVTASSYHPGGAQIALGDGSIRFVAETIDQLTWWASGTKAGGESLQLP